MTYDRCKTGDVVDEDGNPIETKASGGGGASADDDLAKAGLSGNDNKVRATTFTHV